MSFDVPMTDEQYESLRVVHDTVAALHAVFDSDGFSPEALRMSAGVMRSAANTLEAVADGWPEDPA